ncbi:hypothetical protein HBB16_08420 [Pseudonocardia sp. MCCB 268]|nr:hypothetical protein [Pseudonocardia cytotoxica]
MLDAAPPVPLGRDAAVPARRRPDRRRVLIADPGWSGRERCGGLADVAADVVVPVDGIDGPGTERDGHRAGSLHTHRRRRSRPGTPARSYSRRPPAAPAPRPSSPTPFQSTAARVRRARRAARPVSCGPPSSTLYLFGALRAACGIGLLTRDRFQPADARTAGTVHLVPASCPRCSTSTSAGRVTPSVIDLRRRARRACVGRTLYPVAPGHHAGQYYGSAERSLIATRYDGGPLRPVDGVRLEAARRGVLWVDTRKPCSGGCGPASGTDGARATTVTTGPARRRQTLSVNSRTRLGDDLLRRCWSAPRRVERNCCAVPGVKPTSSWRDPAPLTGDAGHPRSSSQPRCHGHPAPCAPPPPNAVPGRSGRGAG